MAITQRMKIKNLLEANGMKGCRTSATPLAPKEKLKSLKEDPSQEPATISEHQTYMKGVGSIQYIACVTRPDFAFVAHSLAKHIYICRTQSPLDGCTACYETHAKDCQLGLTVLGLQGLQCGRSIF